MVTPKNLEIYFENIQRFINIIWCLIRIISRKDFTQFSATHCSVEINTRTAIFRFFVWVTIFWNDNRTLVLFTLTKKLANKWSRKWTGRPSMADRWKLGTVKLAQNPDTIEMRPKARITGQSRLPGHGLESLGRPNIPLISNKACLHVGGIVENASEKLIELKFGVFGSIGEVKFLPDKNIGKSYWGHLQVTIGRNISAFVELQSQYADRCIEYLHGSLFYG